jgi:hypothetical protein
MLPLSSWSKNKRSKHASAQEMGCLCRSFFRPNDGWISTELHSVTTKKISTVTAVKMSNSTKTAFLMKCGNTERHVSHPAVSVLRQRIHVYVQNPLAYLWGTRQHSWLSHYATSRKVPGSSADELTGLYNWPHPSNRTMALGSTRPLTEMSTRNLRGG